MHWIGTDDPLRPETGTSSGGASLRDAGYEDDSLLLHLSPLGWEHINLAGDYSWQQNRVVAQFQSPRGFRALYVTTTEFAPTQAFLELSADSAPHT